jgi:hypothetical protein
VTSRIRAPLLSNADRTICFGYVLNGRKRDIGSTHKTPNGLENFQVYQQRNL